jgi:hypothetical protein
VSVEGVTHLRLVIRPDRSGQACRTSLILRQAVHTGLSLSRDAQGQHRIRWTGGQTRCSMAVRPVQELTGNTDLLTMMLHAHRRPGQPELWRRVRSGSEPAADAGLPYST